MVKSVVAGVRWTPPDELMMRERLPRFGEPWRFRPDHLPEFHARGAAVDDEVGIQRFGPAGISLRSGLAPLPVPGG